MKYGVRLTNSNIKLFLYVSTASLASLLSDLNHMVISQCVDSSEHSPKVKLAIMAINFILQGLIAWRAFIDDSHPPLPVQNKGDLPHN